MPIIMRGIPQTRRALEKARLEIEAASGIAVKEAGKVVANEMLSRAPRQTGRLAASISTSENSLGGGATAQVGADVPYDRFVQHGTRYMSAQPYGEDAAQAAAPGVVAAMLAVYKAAVE